MSLVDFHSHILPHMDDGAKDADTSLGMLSALASQGVSTVYATPHFYADADTVDSFLERRDRAYAELCSAMEGKSGLPEVRLGAEIMICKQLARMDISRLVFKDIPVMLFEYPVRTYEKWFSEYTERIAAANAATAMVAHFDRYMWTNKKTLGEFCSLRDEVYFQMNCEGFSDRKNVKLLDELYKRGCSVVLGSDCHNLSTRKPDFDLAVKTFDMRTVKLDGLGLSKTYGAELLDALRYSQKRVQSASRSNGLLF
ncbi:MAG: hypothetical protein IJN63_08075 [Clostridia bacterium]|nr:hypothetical protein [Clostridia bacterium]